eukprot:1759209-Amphidinium_carterae.2
MSALEALVVEAAKVSKSYAQAGIRELYVVAEECKLFLKSWVQNCLLTQPTAHVLYQYSLDTTPLKIRSYYNAGGGKKLSAIKAEDYLVQVLSVTVGDEIGSQKHCIYFAEPILIQHGKGNLALAGIAARFLADSGVFVRNERLEVFHQVHDRGMGNGLRSFISGEALSLVGASNDDESSGDDMTCFHVESGCCLHDCQNALRWVWGSVLNGSADVLRLLYTGISIYRKSVGCSIGVISGWLAGVLDPKPLESCQSEDALTEYYRVLGVDAGVLDLMACKMHLWWNMSTGRLEIIDTFMSSAACIEELTALLLQIWRFPAFAASRWLTVGSSLRCLVLGYSTGFHSCFAWMRQHGVVSDYEGSLADDLKDNVIVFACIIGVVAHLPEAVLARLMSDNRLMLHWTECHAEMEEELASIVALSESTFELFGKLCGKTSLYLRSKLLAGAYMAASYINMRVFAPTSALPWNLCLGDIEGNMTSLLAETDPPADLVSKKLWSLHRAGFSQSQLVRVVHLLQSCSFTSYLVERLHASAATIKKKHSH